MHDKALQNYLQNRENHEKEKAWKQAVKQFHREFPADLEGIHVVADEKELDAREQLIQSEPDNCQGHFHWGVYANSTKKLGLTVEVSYDSETWKDLHIVPIIRPLTGLWLSFIPFHNYMRVIVKNISKEKSKILLATHLLDNLQLNGKGKKGR